MFRVINPATGEEGKTYPGMTDAELIEIVAAAHTTYLQYRRTPFNQRADWLRRAGKVLYDRKTELAELMVEEMGKLFKEAEQEVEKCAWNCLYFADQGEAFLQPEYVSTEASKSYVTFEPLGVLLAIMPWNFPFWQVFRFAAPALMAGNTIVMKHAPNVPGCSQAIEAVFREAGFPEGAFRSLFAEETQVASLIANRLIRAVTITGSTRAGSAVATAAGRHLKKSVLELGGSDPYLVLEDADLDLAAQVCARSRMLNNGQSCIAAKRFIVVRQVYDAFLSRFTEEMQQYRMGDPLDPNTTLGPMARFDLRDQLHRQVLQSVERGAQIQLGGALPDRSGAYYPPTILVEVQKDSPAYSEELFGPVAAVLRAWDEEEAILIANDTMYGLGAGVFTQDVARGERIARYELEAGNCFVNEMVRSDPRLPFGGIKDSGFGRELSHFGMKEFVNTKTIYLS